MLGEAEMGSAMVKKKVANGIFWVEIPEADLRILCGCPVDSVKHLFRSGLIAPVTRNGVTYETGPNAILLSDTSIQHGSFANLAEFPLLQMFYRQGMIIPGHPNNTGRKPLLIGLGDQVRSQAEYFSRGSYGLRSMEEIEAAGVTPTVAREIFGVKRWFAFDRIRSTEELVDLIFLDSDARSLAPGVVVHRTGFNRYEFSAFGGSVEVDLALAPGEQFEPSYTLPTSGVKRERFSIIHTGEGDGWDPLRPAMASIVCSDGLLYLVDAGPHITRSLDALGLGVGDIEGIFHTHAHDDHFAGLTSLVRSEKRLKYFAVPFVRESVQKKLAALMRIEETRLYRFFDVHDLLIDEWNTVGGMQVKPSLSPHPVETTVFFFRSGDGNERRTYAHLADIASRDVIARLAEPRGDRTALSPLARQRIEQELAAPVDLKKVDVGGGLIHGNPLDFADDASGRIILSHGVIAVPPKMGAKASMVSFGDVDVLIAGLRQDFLLGTSRASLAALFPGVPGFELDILAACPIRSFPPGAVLDGGAEVLLVLSGEAEEKDVVTGETRRRSGGALLGAHGADGAHGENGRAAVRAVGELAALVIPADTYEGFARRDGHADARRLSIYRRGLLSQCPLFAQVTSENVLNAMAASMQERSLSKGQIAAPAAGLCLLVEGEGYLTVGARQIERLGPGGFWGEESLVDAAATVCEAHAISDCRYLVIPAAALADVPILQWTLQESFEKRLHSFRADFRFEWADCFRVDVRLLDEQHRRMFSLAKELSDTTGALSTLAGHDEQKTELLRFTLEHFAAEEALLEKHRYPRLAVQKKAHGELVVLLEKFIAAGERRSRPRPSTPADYLKDWLIRHTLLEDLQYRSFFARIGVS